VKIKFNSVNKIFFHIPCFHDFVKACKKFVNKKASKKTLRAA